MTWPLRRTLLLATVALAAAGPRAFAQSLETGRKAYEARCVGCHGSDGGGAGHGPGFVDIRRPRASSRPALQKLIRGGIPGTTMPAFTMTDAELDALVDYVEVLRAPAADHPAAGDPTAGERFFTGRGNCSSCHMVRGKGGILGPDLSDLARERRIAQIEQALREPGTPASSARRDRDEAAQSFKAISLRMRDGRAIRGLAKYEGPFDLGVLGLDGTFHSIPRSEVAEVVSEPSLMPRLEATAEEHRDLLAYLTRLTADRSTRATLPGAAIAGESLWFDEVARPKAGEWPTYHGRLSGNRHSTLDQINTSNVGRLTPKWTFQVPGASGALQVTPVVVEGLMYVTAANAVWALDARTGRQSLALQPPAHVRAGRRSRKRDQSRRRGARGSRVPSDRSRTPDRAPQEDGTAPVGCRDGRLSGSLRGTSAPLVVNDLVIAGVSGGDEGNRGFLDAYKASTGEHAWRFWTVPARGEPGSETWVGKALEHGCAATWLTGTYDADARLLYWPTGNPCPDYNGDERKGDNLYSNSVLALDPDTGKLKWHFQFTPHDLHDWDATETPMLVDATFRGRTRKLLLHADRNGFFYVLDRLTGELLLAEPFVKGITWASGIGRTAARYSCLATNRRPRAPERALRSPVPRIGRRRHSARPRVCST